jgi:hypothetical protein
MANIWKLFTKKDEKKTPIRKSITELTPEERSEIEERFELGTASRDIADSLGLDVNVVYNYKKALRERASAQASKPVDPVKEIIAGKIQQREILKEDLELERLKLGLERERQQMQMDQIRFRKDFEDWKREISEPGEENGDDINIKDLLGLFSQANGSGKQSGFQSESDSIYTEKPFVIKPKDPIKNTQTTLTPQNQPSGNAIEDSQVTADPDAETYIEMTDEEIKKIISGFDKKHIKRAKLLPDKVLFDKIADQFPTISDQSIDRAIQILRSEY